MAFSLFGKQSRDLTEPTGRDKPAIEKAGWDAVRKINALAPKIDSLNAEQIKLKIQAIRAKIKNKATPDELLPEVFALVRRAAELTLYQRHYDVQLFAGFLLHKGIMTEMSTGEGKTLAATTAVVLNALFGKGVHVITANSYLARRDAEEMSKLYNLFGLSVTALDHSVPLEMRREQYDKDIVYGPATHFGWDLLQNNKERRPLRQAEFAIVDEVDDTVIDKARHELIISGDDEAYKIYALKKQIIPYLMNNLLPSMPEDHIRKTALAAQLTVDGLDFIEQKLRERKYLGENETISPNNLGGLLKTNDLMQEIVTDCIHAKYVLQRGRDYIVANRDIRGVSTRGIVLIDPNTGRRTTTYYSHSLHQALECKEGLPINPDHLLTAVITIPNLLRKYKKSSGMSGTALSSEAEIERLYGKIVIKVPRNVPPIRVDYPDTVCFSRDEKLEVIAAQVEDCLKRGQPILLSVSSIPECRAYADHLKPLIEQYNVNLQLLNAETQSDEKTMVARAGKSGTLTIATSIAGRGTDIKLGGGDPADREKVLAAGGLFIIGSEHMHDRRIDEQLRGRAGRQGEPGASHFIFSTDDWLFKAYDPSGEQASILKRAKARGELTPELVDAVVTSLQKKAQAYDQWSRQDILDRDDFLETDRQEFYNLRRRVMADPSAIRQITLKGAENIVAEILQNGKIKTADQFTAEMRKTYQINLEIPGLRNRHLRKGVEAVITPVRKAINAHLDKNAILETYMQSVILKIMDAAWEDYLNNDVLTHKRPTLEELMEKRHKFYNNLYISSCVAVFKGIDAYTQEVAPRRYAGDAAQLHPQDQFLPGAGSRRSIEYHI